MKFTHIATNFLVLACAVVGRTQAIDDSASMHLGDQTFSLAPFNAESKAVMTIKNQARPQRRLAKSSKASAPSQWLVAGEDDDAVFWVDKVVSFSTAINEDGQAHCSDMSCRGETMASAQGYDCGGGATCLDVQVEFSNEVMITCPTGGQVMTADSMTCKCFDGGECTVELDYDGPGYYLLVTTTCDDNVDHWVADATLRCKDLQRLRG